MQSVVDNISEEHVFQEPYAHLLTPQALEPDYYKKLSAKFPDLRTLMKKVGGERGMQDFNRTNNLLIHINGLKTFEKKFPVNPVWRPFMKTHFSEAFFHKVIGHLKEGIYQTYPNIDELLGKKLEDLTVQPRQEKDRGADVFLDIQFAFNTPVREPTRVRARHVDDAKKLFSGLLYMRSPTDDSEGGNLEICRWTGEPKFRNPYVEGLDVQNTHIDDDQSVVEKVVEYKANTLIMFVNSPWGIHGVTQRSVTPHIRQYINIIAELRRPLYNPMDYR